MNGKKATIALRPELALLLSLVLFFVTPSLYGQSSENYRLFTSVLDEAGGSPESENNKMVVSSAGQPTPIGISESTNYKVYAGYIYTIEVPCADPPEIVEKILPNGKKGCPYSVVLEVQPGTGTFPLQWTIINGALPEGLDLNETTGEIRGAPEDTGTFTFTIQVTDLCAATDSQAFSITVGPYEHVKGDPNADCVINVLDVLMVANIILEWIDPTEDQIWRADCNGPLGMCDGDGRINVLDAVKIANIILLLDACP